MTIERILVNFVDTIYGVFGEAGKMLGPFEERFVFANAYAGDSLGETYSEGDSRLESFSFMSHRKNGIGKGGASHLHRKPNLQLTGEDGTEYIISREGETIVIKFGNCIERVNSVTEKYPFCKMLKEWGKEKGINEHRIEQALKQYAHSC